MIATKKLVSDGGAVWLRGRFSYMAGWDRDYWLGRWKRGDIAWHQSEIEPALVTWSTELKPTRVFVPLCGKSRDLIWLVAHGFDVVGVELSELACKALFSENQMAYTESSEGPFKVFSGDRLNIFNGDFFNLSPEKIGEVGAVYDRAALIALPSELRARYARHLIKLIESSLAIAPQFHFLQMILERNPHDETGPPFSVTLSDIEFLYGEKFQIELRSREVLTARAPLGTRTEECALSLRPHLK